jgi:3-hydroxyacyl-[acyl-carrier-protein] dehydratase
LDEVRFRGVVRPGDRLVIAAQLVKVRRGAMIVARFQCFVENNLVCEGMIRGIPLSEDLIIAARNVTGPTKTE